MPTLDINLFVHNGQNTVRAAIDSVLAQSWTDWRLTLIDDGSTDGTADILAEAATHPKIRLKRNRCNAGAVGAFQRGLWFGNADFVMPKSADDLIDPDFIARLMDILLANPACVMAHAAGLSFTGAGDVAFVYPETHRLSATGPDPLIRAATVMRHYTSSPSFWGIYRRAAVDRLAPIVFRAGWDHVLLAELALYGEIRHDPAVLYWRRGGGRPVRDLARAATQEAARGTDLQAPFADALWRTPCITTAFAHIENFLIAPVSSVQRRDLIEHARSIFRARWLPLMLTEAQHARAFILDAVERAQTAEGMFRDLTALPLLRLVGAIALLLPEADLCRERAAVASLMSEAALCPG